MPERFGWLLAAFALAGAPLAPALAAGEDSPLGRAILANDVAGAAALLADGADPDEALDFGATPLSWAVNTQNPAMVHALLQAGAKAATADIDGVTPLSLACELGGEDIVAQLIAAGADLRAARPDGTSTLAICARFGPPEAVKAILDAGIPADAADSRGQTPLMWAASAGRTEAMELLLKAGADADRVTQGDFTPLFFAIKSGSVPATRLLLQAGARPDHLGPEDTTAAQLALYQKNYDAAALMLPFGVDLAAHDRNGNQPLHVAAMGGDPALIEALLAAGANPDGLTGPSRITWVTEANFGQPPPPVPPTTPLMKAAESGQVAAMKLLVEAGADPHFVSANGTGVVLAAATSESAETLAYALDLAPDPNVADADGSTAMHLLVGTGNVRPGLAPMLRVLAAHGARTDLPNKRGITAAQMADGGLTEIGAIFRSIFPAEPEFPLAEAASARSVQ
ncbi:conserved hypothetical protein [Altererythrobacter sp. B11]|uniref:ankyrin repeat domain-containing protein n=1 Tax=Altererythrobacter sp. B11 TaxID=2060312 RepID=UPI000DC73177|nr:ankyrin repeat domain-containing protein [Altererythrobacter sp. B11]BBC73850.1 conserved hypothetical protein [Altererythrobacter sp. B11]